MTDEYPELFCTIAQDEIEKDFSLLVQKIANLLKNA